MKCLINSVLCGLFLVTVISCETNSVSPAPAADPAPAAPISRLIFTADAHTGGTVKLEIKDSDIEAVLDGNSAYESGVANPLYITEHTSAVQITLTDVVYYSQVVSVSCESNNQNKMEIRYSGPFGTYFDGPLGKLYRFDGTDYVEQAPQEEITTAEVHNNYTADCSGSDGNSYQVYFYPETDPQGHTIDTIFSVPSGSIKGILRIYRVGETIVSPYIHVDLLL